MSEGTQFQEQMLTKYSSPPPCCFSSPPSLPSGLAQEGRRKEHQSPGSLLRAGGMDTLLRPPALNFCPPEPRRHHPSGEELPRYGAGRHDPRGFSHTFTIQDQVHGSGQLPISQSLLLRKRARKARDSITLSTSTQPSLLLALPQPLTYLCGLHTHHHWATDRGHSSQPPGLDLNFIPEALIGRCFVCTPQTEGPDDPGF